MDGLLCIESYSQSFVSRFVLGTCLKAMGVIEKAAEAYVTSLEYQQYLPLRDFSDVLYS